MLKISICPVWLIEGYEGEPFLAEISLGFIGYVRSGSDVVRLYDMLQVMINIAAVPLRTLRDAAAAFVLEMRVGP